VIHTIFLGLVNKVGLLVPRVKKGDARNSNLKKGTEGFITCREEFEKKERRTHSAVKEHPIEVKLLSALRQRSGT